MLVAGCSQNAAALNLVTGLDSRAKRLGVGPFIGAKLGRHSSGVDEH